MVYQCYIVNIFVLFKSNEELKLFVNYMNLKHVKFACETKDLNNFSFLDVNITKKNKQFVTLIFRKAAFSGVFTNYDSSFSDTYKIHLVHTLVLVFQNSIQYGKCSYRSRTPKEYFQM